MRIIGKILSAVLILILFLFTAPSAADIQSVKIQSKYRDTIKLSKFVFSHTGFVSLTISSVAFSSLPVNSKLSPPDPSRVGFFLVNDELLRHFYLKSCPLDSEFISVLFTFQDLAPPANSSFNKTYPMTYPGDYSLYFTNCNDLSSVTMDVHAEFYNTDHNNVKDYLPAGLTQLPSLYSYFSIIYMCLVWFWILVCFKNRRYFNRTHLLMGVFLVMATFHYGCAAVVQQYVKVTGIRPHGWNVLFYIFQFVRKTIFFTMIMVIGTAGCRMFPAKEFFGLILIVFQVCIIWESGPDSEIWSLADFFFCLLSIIPILVSFNDHSFKLSPRERKLRCRFILVAGVYVIFTIFKPWVINVAKETGTLVFCMVMFYMFRPVFDIVDDDQDEEEEIVELDELRPLYNVDDQDEEAVEQNEIRPLFHNVDDQDEKTVKLE